MQVRDREAPERPLVAKVWLSGAFDPRSWRPNLPCCDRLDIPGLVRAHGFDRDRRTGAPFLVEDFVDGETARAFVAAVPERRAARLAYVISEVAATLAALHDAAFVHGDLKPEHVRVTGQDACSCSIWARHWRVRRRPPRTSASRSRPPSPLQSCARGHGRREPRICIRSGRWPGRW